MNISAIRIDGDETNSMSHLESLFEFIGRVLRRDKDVTLTLVGTDGSEVELRYEHARNWFAALSGMGSSDFPTEKPSLVAYPKTTDVGWAILSLSRNKDATSLLLKVKCSKTESCEIYLRKLPSSEGSLEFFYRPA